MSNGATSGSAPDVQSCSDSVTSICSRLSKDDSVRRFLDYVSKLPSDDRLLVVYCALEEYTCAEAAERLGLTPEATNKRWQTLRARMRENGVLRALALEET